MSLYYKHQVGQSRPYLGDSCYKKGHEGEKTEEQERAGPDIP